MDIRNTCEVGPVVDCLALTHPEYVCDCNVCLRKKAYDYGVKNSMKASKNSDDKKNTTEKSRGAENQWKN